jgi:hypothetical protein
VDTHFLVAVPVKSVTPDTATTAAVSGGRAESAPPLAMGRCRCLLIVAKAITIWHIFAMQRGCVCCVETEHFVRWCVH